MLMTPAFQMRFERFEQIDIGAECAPTDRGKFALKIIEIRKPSLLLIGWSGTIQIDALPFADRA